MNARNRFWMIALGVSSVVLLGCLAAVNWAEEEVNSADLPQAVQDKIKEAYPGAGILEAEKETEDGKTEYEVELKVAGKTIEVEFDASGAVLEEEADDEAEDDDDDEDEDDDDDDDDDEDDEDDDEDDDDRPVGQKA